MADNDLTGKVGLDTTEFKTAIAEMNREIRVIESGFRASAAALGNWGDSASGLEMRIKALTGEIDLQKGKVSALRGEYERIAAEKGANSRAAQDLQIKLNKETEALNKMDLELGQTKTALNEMGTESTETAGDVDKLTTAEGDATTATGRLGLMMDGLKNKLGDVGGKFVDLGGKVVDVAKKLAVGLGVAITGVVVGISVLVLKTAATADELVELGEKTGLSVTELQKLKYIGEQTGTSLETVTSSMARLVKSMAAAAKGTGAQADAFKALGVSAVDSNGDLRDSQDVFGDLMTALAGIENETERDALAMALFGKSAQELNPLINLGADGMAAMAEEAENLGAIMSEDAVNGAAELNDKIAGLKAGFAGMVGTLASKFAPAIGKVIDKFSEWMKSPAVQGGLQKIADWIGNIADKIGEMITKLMSGDVRGALEEIFPKSAVDQIMAVTNAINGFIRDTLIPFVTKHAEEIKGAIIAIAAVLAVAGIVSLIAAIANPIGLIVALVGVLGAAWAGNWGGIRDKTMAVIEWLKPYIAAFLKAIKDWWAANGEQVIAVVKKLWDGIKQGFEFGWNIIKIVIAGIKILLDGMKQWWAAHGEQVMAILKGLWEGIKYVFDLGVKIIRNVVEAFIALFQGDWKTFALKIIDIWRLMWDAVIKGAQILWDWLKSWIPKLWANVKAWFLGVDWAGIGRSIVEGIWNGISKAWDWLKGLLAGWVKNFLDYMKRLLGIQSPSTVFEDMGKNMMLGLRDGIENYAYLPQDALQQVVNGLTATNLAQNGALALAGPQVIQGGQAGQVGTGAVNTSQSWTIYGGLHLYGVEDRESLLESLAGLG